DVGRSSPGFETPRDDSGPSPDRIWGSPNSFGPPQKLAETPSKLRGTSPKCVGALRKLFGAPSWHFGDPYLSFGGARVEFGGRVFKFGRGFSSFGAIFFIFDEGKNVFGGVCFSFGDEILEFYGVLGRCFSFSWRRGGGGASVSSSPKRRGVLGPGPWRTQVTGPGAATAASGPARTAGRTANSGRRLTHAPRRGS